jgi:hypothetical protein
MFDGSTCSGQKRPSDVRLTRPATSQILQFIKHGKLHVCDLEGVDFNDFEMLVFVAAELLVLKGLAQKARMQELAEQLDRLHFFAIEQARGV